MRSEYLHFLKKAHLMFCNLRMFLMFIEDLLRFAHSFFFFMVCLFLFYFIIYCINLTKQEISCLFNKYFLFAGENVCQTVHLA